MTSFIELKKIAFRNAARHRVKTILTAAAVAVSVAVCIFINSWLGAMAIESRRNIVNYETGAAKLQTRLYFEKRDEMPGYENFTGWEVYAEALASRGYITAPRYVFSGTLYSASGSAPIVFNGVDPAAERELLRYASFVDFGRYPQNGAPEIALGTLAAEKLRVGIPTRPCVRELEDLIAALAPAPEDASAAGAAAFIRSLYVAEDAGKGAELFARVKQDGADPRVYLKRDASRADLDRYWNLAAASGRNNVRINALIDIKAAPETIGAAKWDAELWPALRDGDRAIVQAAYGYQDFMNAWLLVEEDDAKRAAVLDAMIRAGFSGAVRHVNQLIDAVVVGVINSPDPAPNGNIAYMPLDALQGEQGMDLRGAVTELLIRERGVPDDRLPGASESAPAITAALERGLAARGRTLPPELAVYTWQDIMSGYLGYEQVQTGFPQILAFLLLLLGFLGISNTILMAIMERTKEMGMMRALGMTDGEMIWVYVLEAGFVGLIGSVAGMIIGCAANWPMVEYGLDFSAMAAAGGGSIGFRTTGLFRSAWNVAVIFGAGIAATALAACMAILPARRAVKKPITESLRFE